MVTHNASSWSDGLIFPYSDINHNPGTFPVYYYLVPVQLKYQADKKSSKKKKKKSLS